MKFDLKLKLMSRLPPKELFQVLKNYDIFLQTAEIDAICELPNFPECMNLLVESNPRMASILFKRYLTDEHRLNLKRRGYDDQGRLYPGS